MTSKRELAIVVSALKHAAPYIRLFKGKVFVLKAGGEIFADKAATTALMAAARNRHSSRPRWASTRPSSTAAA
jgi:hypothetical protein